MNMPFWKRAVRTPSAISRKTGLPAWMIGILIAISALCLLLVAGNFGLYNVLLPSIFKNFAPPPVTISAITVAPVTWTPGLEAVGTAKAVYGVDVPAEVGGVVTAINFKSNDRVESGAILIQLDDSVERADLIAAEANIKFFEAQYERSAELRKKGVTSQAALDDARAQIDVAKSNQASLLATTEKKAIKALFSGTVGIQRVDVGEYVEPGTPLVTLQDLSQIKVDFTVPEQLAGQIAAGAKVAFGETFDALDYHGEIVGIDPKVDPQTRLVPVQALLDNSQGRITPGQFLRVRVELPSKNGVVALPQSAVVQSIYGDHVYVAAPMDKAPQLAPGTDAETAKGPFYTAQQVFVRQGRRSGGLVEILEGVKIGDVVVVSGQNKVFPGVPMRIDNNVDVEGVARKEAGDVR